MRKKVSLKDIAREVGVSIPLVSYVLGDKGKENRVSEKTAERIREVARRLNYRPNLHARSLRTNRTHTIGVILADISNPFFAHLARVIEDGAFSRNYIAIFGSSDENTEKFARLLDFMQARQVDGFIVAAPDGSRELVAALQRSGTPVVMIDRYFRGLDVPQVIVDNYGASLKATEHLLTRGITRIASIGYVSELDHYGDRSRGYADAMAAAGLPAVIERVHHTTLESDMDAVIDKLIREDRAEALFFQTNTLGEAGLSCLLKLGREVLSATEVVVFDQSPTYQFLHKDISYVDQPIRELAEASLGLLIDILQEEPVADRQLKLPAELKTLSSDSQLRPSVKHQHLPNH